MEALVVWRARDEVVDVLALMFEKRPSV